MKANPLKAYKVPLHALWLPRTDQIEIRVTAGRRGRPRQSIRKEVTVRLDQASRLLGVLAPDDKRLGLGRWLRRSWEETEISPDEPAPPSTVVYDEAAQMAYFSVWPNLSGGEIQEVHRRAELVLGEDGELMLIRMPVKVRRRSEDALSAAAGYLPNR